MNDDDDLDAARGIMLACAVGAAVYAIVIAIAGALI